MNVNPKSKFAYQLLHNGILALAKAERAGIRVDADYLQKQYRRLTRRIERLEREFKSTKLYLHWKHTRKSDPNLYSNYQLAHFLYYTKKLKPAKVTASGQGATDEEALSKLNIPELKTLLQLRKLRKIRDTYLDAFYREQVDGYIHPSFNLHLVRTFRSSSDHPNFQNIPKRDKEAMQIVRRALYPRPGHQLMEVDYSGLEVRISACYNKDPVMIRYIKNPDSDMHRDMAEQIFKLEINPHKPGHKTLRQAAKNGFVFPEFYGDYYGNCARNMACNWGELPEDKWSPGQGIEIELGVHLSDHLIKQGFHSLGEFTHHIHEIETDFWENRFQEYAAWKRRWWKLYLKYGYIDLLTGFRCSGVMSQKDVCNYPIQGSAFHCLLWSFIQVQKSIQERHWDTRVIGQIHDSIILDVHPDELEEVYYTVKDITTIQLPKAWDWIIVPLDVKFELCPIDGSWAEKDDFVLT